MTPTPEHPLGTAPSAAASASTSVAGADASGGAAAFADAPAIRITALLGNSQRLDGGAMFGNAPRALWSRLCPPDEQNRIALACRTLLVEVGDRRMLLET